ncbi:hypothetical protein ACHAW5_007839 [Stephanodiscus triporus]|uniref:Transmembrane protein n=1 Tax=Stephanodiscus triporus TaxID=2934178 RepID=A0ABD3Q911_9STRA
MFILPTVYSNAMNFVLDVASFVTPPTVATAAAAAKLATTRLLEDFAKSIPSTRDVASSIESRIPDMTRVVELKSTVVVLVEDNKLYLLTSLFALLAIVLVCCIPLNDDNAKRKCKEKSKNAQFVTAKKAEDEDSTASSSGSSSISSSSSLDDDKESASTRGDINVGIESTPSFEEFLKIAAVH